MVVATLKGKIWKLSNLRSHPLFGEKVTLSCVGVFAGGRTGAQNRSLQENKVSKHHFGNGEK